MRVCNDPKHQSKFTTGWLQKNKIPLLEWPKPHTRRPKNMTELKQFCLEEWTTILPERSADLKSTSY
uniref:Tc1-like transposase DDE domain-containing protein n=1 Tax=Anabas testudineus TaxID=64144 RepID=A0A3Q1HDF1_ANATE